MAFEIDSEVHTYVDAMSTYKAWSAGIDSELPCSPKSSIAKTGMSLHTHASIH